MTSVRIATAADEASLLELCEMAHAENGYWPYAPDKIEALVHPVLHPNGHAPANPTLIGVCGPIGEVRASACVMLTQAYYSHHWGMQDLWVFVRPEHRRTRYHRDLLEWTTGIADRMRVTLMAGVLSNDRTEAKMQLYRRVLGQPVGGFYFCYKPDTETALDTPRRDDGITA